MKIRYVLGIIVLSRLSIIQGEYSMSSTNPMMKLFFKDLPVLVTGGAGFIGSHLVEKLVSLGAHVTVLDDLSSGSLDNLVPVKDKIIFIQGSVTDEKTCLDATRGVAVVFHLAACISVPDSLKNPALCYRTNVMGTFNVLEACRMHGVERFVFSSSAAVYGSECELCSEESPTHPESPYGASKLIGELACRQYARDFGLQTVCLRYFNVYGERQNSCGSYAAVVSKFRYQMQHNMPITIFGDGLQTRDFISVHEVVSANVTLAMLESDHMHGDVFNIATGNSITLLALIDKLKTEFSHYSQPVHFASARSGDIKNSRANCKKYLDIAK